jgi:putative membrane protein
MRSLPIATIILLGAAVTACTNETYSNPPPGPHAGGPNNFVKIAASSDQFEIQSSRLVLQKTRSQKVKRIAQHLIADHTKSSNEMKAILASQNIPAPPPALLPHQQEMLDRLHNERHMSHAYLEEQEKAHEEAIRMFETYSTTGKDPALRDFAARTLPTLRQHYQMVEQALGKPGSMNPATMDGYPDSERRNEKGE